MLRSENERDDEVVRGKASCVEAVSVASCALEDIAVGVGGLVGVVRCARRNGASFLGRYKRTTIFCQIAKSWPEPFPPAAVFPIPRICT
jgi:hypothetical protein